MHPNKPTDVAGQVTELWTAHRTHVQRLIARKAHTAAADPMVEDALTETIIRTIRFLAAGGRIQRDPVSFLTTIAWREYLRLLATAQRQRRNDRSFHEIELPAEQPEDLVLDGLAAQLDGQLKQALARLTPQQRAVLTDNHAGYTYDEIAQRHGLSWTAVNKAVQRGRRKLREDGALDKAYREWSD